MKLVKIQREILANAVWSEKKFGSKKPIHVNSFGCLDNFSKNYQRYCEKMEQLVDAGLISRNIYPSDSYAYVVDIAAAQGILNAN
jgi:hypothetical protein|tara:strand:- start:58 stop:312 length:255 start_codon:yes stop_codon:yes gene_type:complete